MPLSFLSGVLGLLLSVAAHSAQAQVYRCGNTYSDAPCPGAQALDLRPPVQAQATPGQRPVFLCRRSSEHFWSSQSCNHHGASTLHRQNVPSDWPWEQQWQHAQRTWRQAQQRAQEAVPAQPPALIQAPPAHGPSPHAPAASCAAADARIRQLDALGRQGGPVSVMERLRRERKALRDWQFRVRC